MTKEIHDINTRALDFVVELIEYIFEYPNDDYMTMECLCRKLHKHGLIDKKDGYYLVADDTLRKTEPQTIRCPKCGRSDYIREFGKDFSVTAEEAGFKYKCINCNTYIEPQTKE